MLPWSPSESLGDMPWLIAWAALAAARRISMSDIVLSKALQLKHQNNITIPCLVQINSELGKFISEKLKSLWHYMMTSRVCDTRFSAALEWSELAWKIGHRMSMRIHGKMKGWGEEI